jgi:hypothetical protein
VTAVFVFIALVVPGLLHGLRPRGAEPRRV